MNIAVVPARAQGERFVGDVDAQALSLRVVLAEGVVVIHEFANPAPTAQRESRPYVIGFPCRRGRELEYFLSKVPLQPNRPVEKLVFPLIQPSVNPGRETGKLAGVTVGILPNQEQRDRRTSRLQAGGAIDRDLGEVHLQSREKDRVFEVNLRVEEGD